MAYKIPRPSASIPTNSVTNLGITYSGSTFSVTSANGTALSASNPGTVIINSAATPGLVVAISVTANQTFIDDSGASTIVGNTFGFGASETMAADVPFYIYAVGNDNRTAISFGISRTPSMQRSPDASLIGKTGSAVADTNSSMFLLGNPTVADYDLNPCIMIGSFNMRLTSAGDWTVQALDDYVGIGRFQERRRFDLTGGVFAAAAGSFFQANGGTAPIWVTQSYNYCVCPFDGLVNIAMQCTGGGGTAGAGAVNALVISPFGHMDFASTGVLTVGCQYAGTIANVNVSEGDANIITPSAPATFSTPATLVTNFGANSDFRINVTYPIYIP